MEQKGQPIHIITSIAIALANNPKNKKVLTVATNAQLRDYTEAISIIILHTLNPLIKQERLVFKKREFRYLNLFKAVTQTL